MGPVVNRLIGHFGTGVGMAAEYNEHVKTKKATQFTPSASEAGDEPVASSSARPSEGERVASSSTNPMGQPATSNSALLGDEHVITSSTLPESHPAEPSGLPPPTYAESVDLGSDRNLDAGPPAQGDHKIQHDDELVGDDSSSGPDYDSDLTLDDLVDEDEAAWALDEYAASHAPPSYEDATTVVSEDDLVREIIAGQQAHDTQQTPGRLPCPVIIPQRRPRNKSRGFVRAYAPVLQNVGISQDTFLRFLSNFHKSTQASPWFTVVEVSSVAAHAAGPAIGFAVEAAVKAAVMAGRNIEVAHKTNNFLDRMNDELFKPAGTYAFLMKYKTEAGMPEGGDGFFGVMAANINLSTNQTQPKQGDGVSGLTKQMSMFRIASGVTERADDLPESAPLIFPEIDDEVARHGDQSLKSKGGELQSFVQDYLDRRAQITFAREDSKSGLKLHQEKTEMKSTLADPDHPMWNGGVVGLLTGGYLNLKDLRTQRQEARKDRWAARHERRQERREVRQEARQDRRERRGYRSRGLSDRRHGGSSTSVSLSTPVDPTPEPEVRAEASTSKNDRGKGRRRRHRRAGGVRGTVQRAMTEDVVYLMIVNMPTDLELSATVQTA